MLWLWEALGAHHGIWPLNKLIWHIAGMTKASTEHASEPMREMKKPNPGTNIATSATMTTIPIRMVR